MGGGMSNVLLRLLGAMELQVDGHVMPLGPAKQRTVLAALAVDAGRPVPLEMLIGRVWDEQPPDQVRAALYCYVTRLRRLLQPIGDRITLRRHTAGYVLDLDPESVDLLRFNRLTRAAAQGMPQDATGLVTHGVEHALGLWRGPVLADLSGEWVLRTRLLLEQHRLDVVLQWARAQLIADRPATVVEVLRELVALHPFVEPLTGLLMQALHRDGRAAEALDCYTRVRQRLVDQLGTEPGAALRDLHLAILRGDQRPTAGTIPPARCTLPADTGGFTGRASEIERIAVAAAAGREPVVCAITGMPGVGKTALAVHVAHNLRDRFPHGQLFVDLHGHSDVGAPDEPGEVLASLLTADGVDPRHLPDGTEARSALWRERIAERRVVLVLDNASDSRQVSPLLPGSAGGLVLVTSRRYLGDLPPDAITVSLDVLTPADAEQMFRSVSQRPVLPDQVADVVAACGFLPLAVSLSARVLRRHGGWTVADLLHEASTRVLDISAERATVAAAFGLSYRSWPTEQQRFFRFLALHPRTGFGPHAAAALAGVELGEAIGCLTALHAENLLIEIGHRRYAMHDLVRSYAAALCADETTQDRTAAIARPSAARLRARTCSRAPARSR
jgi:DNA-binding SARP family transcriptional activator